MKKNSFFEGWGYTDSIRLLIKGEPKDRNEFIKEFKKTYPKSQIEKSGQKGVELYVNEGELTYVKKLVRIFNLKLAYIDGGKTEYKIGGNVPEKKLIYVLYGVKDQADSILNANGTRNRGWWRSDLSRTESDNLLNKLKERKLIFGAIIYVGDSTNIKFNLGGAIEDEEEDLFANYDKLPIKIQKIIADFSEDDNSYEDCEKFISKLNKVGYTCEYGLDAEPYGLRKLIPNEKFVKGGKTSSTLKVGDKVEGYFHYDHTYGQYNIIPYNAYADTSEGVVVDIFEGGLLGQRYEIKFKNGETKRLSESMLGEYYDKLRFAKGGGISGIKNGDVFNIILDTNYGIKTEPYRVIVKVVDDKVNSRGQVTILHIEGKMKGTKTDIQVSKLKNQYAEGGIPQGMSIADANPYIAGAKVVQGIAPESVSALDKKMADRINPPPPDPNRPIFFVEGGYVAELKPYFDDMIGYNRFGKDNIVDYFLKNQHNFITLRNEIESAERGIEKQYYEHEKMPFHSFVKKYNTVFKQFYHYSSSASDDKIKAEELIENLKEQGYTVVTKTYIFTKGSYTPKNNKAINIFAYKLKF